MSDICSVTGEVHQYPESYDSALPLDWAVEAQDKVFRVNPDLHSLGMLGHIVWSYDGPGLLGRPMPCCSHGVEYLEVVRGARS